jgi:hypothetical protein
MWMTVVLSGRRPFQTGSGAEDLIYGMSDVFVATYPQSTAKLFVSCTALPGEQAGFRRTGFVKKCQPGGLRLDDSLRFAG